MKLQKIGGIGSIGKAILDAISLVFFLLVLPRLGLVGPSDWFVWMAITISVGFLISSIFKGSLQKLWS